VAQPQAVPSAAKRNRECHRPKCPDGAKQKVTDRKRRRLQTLRSHERPQSNNEVSSDGDQPEVRQRQLAAPRLLEQLTVDRVCEPRDGTLREISLQRALDGAPKRVVRVGDWQLQLSAISYPQDVRPERARMGRPTVRPAAIKNKPGRVNGRAILTVGGLS
jgi:hypothetical protein